MVQTDEKDVIEKAPEQETHMEPGKEAVKETAKESAKEAGKKKKKGGDKAEAPGRIDELTQRLDEAEGRYKRVMAEFDNFRKRTQREKAEMYDDGTVACVLRFLPVVDGFERALLMVDEKTLEEDNTLKGLSMIFRQMTDVLTQIGITHIPAEGKPFDPNLHSAVMTAAAEGDERGTVAAELLKGYMYKNKPIRHSMVKVYE